jgi:hypothetical protein
MTKNVTFGWTLLFFNSCENRIIRKIYNYQEGWSLLNWLGKNEIGSPKMKGPGRGKEREV